MPQSAPSRNSAWCNRAEALLIAGSIGSSVAAVVLQQVTFAAITSIQLSFVVGLNSWSRKRFDEVNQQNQTVITQLQQQLLQGQNSFNQIEQVTRQLPTYKEIGDLQHHLERLETDNQKRINQLHEDLEKQEDQFNQLRKELSSLQQAPQSIPFVDVDSFQNEIHNLKSRFELKFRELKGTNHSLVDQVENRVAQVEKTVNKLLEIADSTTLFSAQIQGFRKEIAGINVTASKLSFLSEFDPETLHADVQGLSVNLQKLESRIHEMEINLKKISLINTEVENRTPQTQELFDFDFIQSEIDELDGRNQKLYLQISTLTNQLESYSSSITHRFQKSEIESTARFGTLEAEIKRIYVYIDSRINKNIPNPPGLTQPNTAAKSVCAWCGKVCNSFVKGRVVEGYIFCSTSCRKVYEDTEDKRGH
ncbi:MAG: hypothetical protein KME12_13940 [Trichocoleus desertorum ATA4-8-CV12]|jgi:uncharacterized coiled-coil DUF342 family protein|nr:hypothetical protein [Trichocoleus desertorum ATA4-8-CV12]